MKVEDKFYVSRGVTVKGELGKKDRSFICERQIVQENVTNVTMASEVCNVPNGDEFRKRRNEWYGRTL